MKITPLVISLFLLPLFAAVRFAAPIHSESAVPQDKDEALLGINAQLRSCRAELDSDHAQIAALRAELAVRPAGKATSSNTSSGPFTVIGTDVYLTGYNLHIQSGSGSTEGTPNGLGNLIVGYNELRGGDSDTRIGSHNIILGVNNNYSSYGGIIAGAYNDANGPLSSILGGFQNNSSGRSSVIINGIGNSACARYTTVVSGQNNAASLDYSVVQGHSANRASVASSILPLPAQASAIDTHLTSLQTGASGR